MPNPRRLSLPVLAAAAALALAGCAPPAAPIRGKVALTQCRLPGIERPALCGRYPVWEDREAKRGRRIELKIAVIPARRHSAEPDPLVPLAGGPGQGAIAIAQQVGTLFSRLNDSRDIVLVDQRGTGGSNPLDCDSADDRSTQALFEETLPEKRVRECLASLDADPRLYATSTAVEDLDEVLDALGYAKVNLWGGSYGTRVALEFLRRHPGKVRTATLDGVAPPQMKLPLSFVADGGAAFERTLGDCEADAACAKAYPALRRDVSDLRARLARHPERVSITDPVTGEPFGLKVTENVFLTGLFRPLYVPELASLLPLAIARAADGDFTPLLAQNLEFTEDVGENLALGMHLSVICSEDVPLITPADLAAASRAFFGRALVDDFVRACALWPKARVPADFHGPVRAEAPVLLLSGGLDPATPPRYGAQVAATLPNARHAVAPNLSHGVSGHGCAPRLLEQFVRTADARGLDASCLKRIPRPLFVLPVGSAS